MCKVEKLKYLYISFKVLFQQICSMKMKIQNVNRWIQMHLTVKSGAVVLCFDIFYSLILAADMVIYLSFAIINGSLLNYVAVTASLCIIPL